MNIQIESRAVTIRNRVSPHVSRINEAFRKAAKVPVSSIINPDDRYHAKFGYGEHTFTPLEGSYALALSHFLADNHAFVPSAIKLFSLIINKQIREELTKDSFSALDRKLAYLAVKTVEAFAEADNAPWEVFSETRNLFALAGAVFDILKTKPEEGPDGALVLAILSFPDIESYSALTGRDSN